MEKYDRLTRVERYQIQALLQSGQSIRQIGKVLKRAPSTISREVHRGGGGSGSLTPSAAGYSALGAHARALRVRQNQRTRTKKIQGELRRFIDEKLEMQWSPEQIAGRLKMLHPRKPAPISALSIYRYIYFEALHCNSTLYLNLRRRRKRRKSHALCRKNVVSSYVIRHAHAPSIESRPSTVERRHRLGDYERDLIRGAEQSQGFVLTLVERASRRTSLAKLSQKLSQTTHEQTVKLLKGQEGPVHTITNDNGSEFFDYEQTQGALGAKIYFAHPYSSWERGTNEYTNGLIRQYLPKTLDFATVTEDQLRFVERRLNERPRKCLGYRTPNEVFNALLRKTGVALAL